MRQGGWAAETVEAQQQLEHARRSFGSVVGGDELARLMLAEEHLHTIQVRVARLMRRRDEEQYAAAKARAEYSLRRVLLLRNIRQLQLLHRRTRRAESTRQ
jgi:hypothetical protein